VLNEKTAAQVVETTCYEWAHADNDCFMLGARALNGINGTGLNRPSWAATATAAQVATVNSVCNAVASQATGACATHPFGSICDGSAGTNATGPAPPPPPPPPCVNNDASAQALATANGVTITGCAGIGALAAPATGAQATAIMCTHAQYGTLIAGTCPVTCSASVACPTSCTCTGSGR
jgi:hypothetical protein